MESGNKKYKITAAVLMAAGMGKRLRPLSEDTPKPLIVVNGIPMIESSIRAIRQAGIEKIYITVGYKKEKYYYLKEKYGNIEFIENTEYQTKNTISSFHAVMDYIKDENIILSESDLYIADPSIYINEVDESCYYICDAPDNNYEWGFILDENDRIKAVQKPDENVTIQHRLFGIAYWTNRDFKIIKDAVIEAYTQPGHEALCYDEAYSRVCDKVDAGVIRIKEGQIYEVDNIHDLVAVDKSYEKYLNNEN